MYARERTAHWVQSHTSSQGGYYTPSIPPSDLDDYSSPPSEAESSHSLPPRMVLRYDDGRDMPIPRPQGNGHHTHSRRQIHVHPTPYGGPLPGDVRSRAHRAPAMPNAPEQIRVLPSGETVHAHPRTHSSPLSSAQYSAQPHPQQIHPRAGPFPPGSHAYQESRSRHPHSGRHGYSSSMAHIPGSNYGPYPHIQHPHHVGPNGVIYSHSAPPALIHHAPPNTATYPHMGVSEHHHAMSGIHAEGKHARTRATSLSGHHSRPQVQDYSDSGSSDSEAGPYRSRSRSKRTASSGDRSVTTATSSGRSPVTPSSRHDKRPFFQRLVHFAEKISHVGPSRASSVTDEPRVRRRHSIIGSRR
ncbi:hypothetical protein M378DRAFT_13601 [Amanita muscaria Koide BX008]|uniref:Uncharacterized protein n=1 Tax=Amanita muscaria (strain Koide BX008) TaxID=946122 RepID=A0A0C2SE05_AMAMK|nr:hypothetical protein M378DRAFT_13601 [Amanita muscaria Koide BX008]